jgi:hypothetical protein
MILNKYVFMHPLSFHFAHVNVASLRRWVCPNMAQVFVSFRTLGTSFLQTKNLGSVRTFFFQEASLADISYLFDEGALIDYETQELVKLVRALFADTPQRANMINKLTAGHAHSP